MVVVKGVQCVRKDFIAFDLLFSFRALFLSRRHCVCLRRQTIDIRQTVSIAVSFSTRNPLAPLS